MSWIQTISDEEATGLCAETFAQMREDSPVSDLVGNIYRSLSLRPEVMAAFYRQDRLAAWGGSGLEREEEEMIATCVSSINQCHY